MCILNSSNNSHYCSQIQLLQDLKGVYFEFRHIDKEPEMAN